MNTQNAHRGYTLLEVLIVVIMLAILTTWAVNSWSSLVGNARQKTMINDYHALFSFARWQAASISGIVTICPLNHSNQCTDDWSLPVQVFADTDRDGRPDNGIFRTLPFPGDYITVRSRTAGTGYLRFAANGMVHGRTGGLILCTKGATTELVYLTVNKGGRFRAEYDKDGDGQIITASGDALSC